MYRPHEPVGRHHRKPDFFVVGAPKAGTTSLYNYLSQHPDIFMPNHKEPHFFGGWRQRSEGSLTDYLELFSESSEAQAVGEASTSYLYLENAAEEIKSFRADAKIIIVLRDPTQRAYSHYWNEVRSGFVNNSFEEELREEIGDSRSRWSSFRPGEISPTYYIEPGHYAKHVGRFIDHFGRDRVCIHLFEDLVEYPETICRETFEFLDVDTSRMVETGRVYNVSGPVRNTFFAKILTQSMPVKEFLKRLLPVTWLRTIKEWLLKKNTKTVPEMNPETQAYLQRVFYDDVSYVERLTGRDLQHWRGNDK